MSVSNWPIKEGQTLKRRTLHEMVGGARQWGITSCLQGSAMLVFRNPKVSMKFGYDKWEGEQANGEFHYTGQGARGNQEVSSRANKSLLLSKDRGKPVHLFQSSGTDVTYLGRYELSDNPYRWEVAPDENARDRRVVVFHLMKVEIDHVE